MIFDSRHFKFPLRLRADLCVIGSGAGGSMAAMVAAEAGMRVVVLEPGSFMTPDKMNQRENTMLPKLLWEAGGRTNTDRNIHIYQGKGVGGSTLHNLNLIKRIPTEILQHWIHSRKLNHLPLSTWDSLYAEVESLLSVSDITPEMMNQHNRIFQQGIQQLGWKGGLMKHNRTGCVGSGFCELGCAYDAKNNASKVLIPRLIKANGEVFTHCLATQISHQNGIVDGVKAVVIDPENYRILGEVIVQANQVCLSASATASAAIILRSTIPYPGGTVGQTLRIHPATLVAGEFDVPIRAWEGIPQSFECTEFLNFEQAIAQEKSGKPASSAEKANRLWLIPAFAHPVGTATFLPGYGKEHQTTMERYENIAVITSVLHEHSTGTIKNTGKTEFQIDYQLISEDKQELVKGLQASAEILFTAGAKKVMIPTYPRLELLTKNDIQKISIENTLESGLELAAVHPMGSIPMGDDSVTAAVDSSGRFRHIKGLWIADGSLFPTSIGVPPQLSIYAMGLHVGKNIATNT